MTLLVTWLVFSPARSLSTGCVVLGLTIRFCRRRGMFCIVGVVVRL